MKKSLLVLLLFVVFIGRASAQDNSDREWTVNTRAWSTNYFTSFIYGVAEKAVKILAFKGHTQDSLWAERIIPEADWLFPIGMSKKGFGPGYDIYSPYHRTFSNPFKHIGDWGVGFDVSYKPSVVGAYAGMYFKSQEVIFKEDPIDNDNIRGFYFQPRVGLLFGATKWSIGVGTYFDIVTGCKSSLPNMKGEKDMLKGGLGLDFSLNFYDCHDRDQSIIQFSMPLHNFFNSDYPGLLGMKRKVGYIILSRRVYL